MLLTLLPMAAWGYSPWHEPYIQLLKNISVNYQVEGAICEQVARLELFREYDPRRYEIEVNLQYGSGNQVLGELDVVVIEKYSRKAVLVGEVKCWTDPARAQSKGSAQRERFFDHIRNTSDIWIRQDGVTFQRGQFRDLRQFILIGPSGVRRYGFEREMRLSLTQLMELRKGMMECQKARLCQGP